MGSKLIYANWIDGVEYEGIKFEQVAMANRGFYQPIADGQRHVRPARPARYRTSFATLGNANGCISEAGPERERSRGRLCLQRVAPAFITWP